MAVNDSVVGQNGSAAPGGAVGPAARRAWSTPGSPTPPPAAAARGPACSAAKNPRPLSPQARANPRGSVRGWAPTCLVASPEGVERVQRVALADVEGAQAAAAAEAQRERGEVLPGGAINRRFGPLSALRPHAKNQHTKPIYGGKREGRLTAPGGRAGPDGAEEDVEEPERAVAEPLRQPLERTPALPPARKGVRAVFRTPRCSTLKSSGTGDVLVLSDAQP